MALEYGFFNSVNGDRLYAADDFNKFFEGLISPTGIFANVGDMFQVTPNSNMMLNIGSGKGMINLCWCRSVSTENVTLAASHVTLNRYDAIVLRLDVTNRDISIVVIQGENANSPTQPSILRNSLYYDICLAYIYVGAGVSSISQSDITDKRLDSSVCGLITGLIQQLDTSQFMSQLETWKNEQMSAFKGWYADLTEELNVDTYIVQFEKRVSGTASAIGVVKLDMEGYTYEKTDIFFVSINGLVGEETYDWMLDTSKSPVEMHVNLTSSSNQTNEVYVRVLKSKIGFSTLTDEAGNTISTENNQSISAG